MKSNEIHEIMSLAMKARELGEIFNPMFVGAPGLGKTEIVIQWCKLNKLPYVILTSATLDAPDVRGFPVVSEVNGKQRQITVTPEFWPSEGNGVIILDELNRGPQSIMNCWMALTDARRGFDNYTLPEGWIVAGCINPDNGKYDTNAMDPALSDRFSIFEIGYDKEAFIQYMKDTNWHKDIILFIESGMWTYVLPEDIKNTPGAKYVAPRTWSKVNAALKAGLKNDNELMVYNSILGSNIGKDFYNFKYNESPVFQYDLMKNKKNALEKLKKFSDPQNFKAGMIGITTKDILERADITDDLLIEVIKVIPVEQSRTLLCDLEFKLKDNTILKRVQEKSKEIKALFKSVKEDKK